MKEKQIGIYKIECLINGMLYIGSSIDIQARLTWHKSHLINGTHYKKQMQSDFNLYGIDNFIFEILETTTKEELKELEIKYTNELNAVKHGYNAYVSIGGRYKKTKEQNKKLSRKRIFSDEHKKHLKEAYKRNIERGIKYNKNVFKIKCIETNIIYNSVKEACNILNYTQSKIYYQIKYPHKNNTKGLHFIKV